MCVSNQACRLVLLHHVPEAGRSSWIVFDCAWPFRRSIRPDMASRWNLCHDTSRCPRQYHCVSYPDHHSSCVSSPPAGSYRCVASLSRCIRCAWHAVKHAMSRASVAMVCHGAPSQWKARVWLIGRGCAHSGKKPHTTEAAEHDHTFRSLVRTFGVGNAQSSSMQQPHRESGAVLAHAPGVELVAPLVSFGRPACASAKSERPLCHGIWFMPMDGWEAQLDALLRTAPENEGESVDEPAEAAPEGGGCAAALAALQAQPSEDMEDGRSGASAPGSGEEHAEQEEHSSWCHSLGALSWP